VHVDLFSILLIISILNFDVIHLLFQVVRGRLQLLRELDALLYL
jgi:hypothetical protein